jgi:hypothetical protein
MSRTQAPRAFCRWPPPASSATPPTSVAKTRPTWRLEKDELLDAGGQTPGSALDRIEAHYGLANLYAYQGAMDKAVTQWESAYQIAATQLKGAMPELEEVLGIAYLHKSEMETDVYHHPGERCIFPPRPGVRYQNTGDSQPSTSAPTIS